MPAIMVRMKYKAIIFDIDGTAIPLELIAIPSDKLIYSVKKAQRLVKVCAATGRSLPHSRHLLEALNIKNPCIISGGTQIIDPITEKTLWEKRLSERQVRQILELCLPYQYPIGFSDETRGISAREKRVNGSERIVYIWNVKEEDAIYLQKTFNEIKGVAAHTPGSWIKDRLDIHITHNKATKKQALLELIKILDVEKNEIIGVGDHDNDLPLFESVGFKVAMGNATEKLKESADYITSSVEEDGLAEVIEKFILKNE